MDSLRRALAELDRRSPVLARVGWAQLVVLAGLLVASRLDDTLVLGVPWWVKPARFLLSSTFYVWTLAWLLPFVRWPGRLRGLVAHLTAWVLVAENTAIVAQAARGVRSHFNIETTLDAAVFSGMGLLIGVNTLVQLVFLGLLLGRPAEGPDLTARSGARFGAAFALLGSALGFVMIAQGGHSVGAPDGGARLPLLGWNAAAGDLRIAHALALHGFQLVPLAAALAARWGAGWPEPRRRALVRAAAALLLLAVAATLAQALAGRPLWVTGDAPVVAAG